jgi:hypothetical protein
MGKSSKKLSDVPTAKALLNIAGAVPTSGSNKDLISAAISSADFSNPETVNRMAGTIFGGQTPGTFSAQKAPNRYTQQGAYAVQIPEAVDMPTSTPAAAPTAVTTPAPAAAKPAAVTTKNVAQGRGGTWKQG